MKWAMIAAMLTVFMIQASEGSYKEGGGGYTVRYNGSLYLYDFLEAGLEKSASVDSGVADSLSASGPVSVSLGMGAAVVDGVVDKLNEIHAKLPELGILMFRTLQEYSWRIVDPAIIGPRDIGASPISDKAGLILMPTAFRDDEQKVITINRALFDELSDLNRIGLIFHEITYAIYSLKNGSSYTSYESRQFTSLVFSPSFPRMSVEVFQERVARLIPSTNFLRPEQYAFLQSTEGRQRCEELNQEGRKALTGFLSTLGEIASVERKFAAKYQQCSVYDTNDYPESILVDGQQYPYLGRDMTIHRRQRLFSHYEVFCKVELPRQLDDGSVAGHARFDHLFDYQKASINVLEREIREFWGQCFYGQKEDILRRITSYKITRKN